MKEVGSPLSLSALKEPSFPASFHLELNEKWYPGIGAGDRFPKYLFSNIMWYLKIARNKIYNSCDLPKIFF